MKRSREDEVPFQLNLPLTKTPEFLKKIADIIKQDYPCPNQPKMPDFTENTKALTPPETPKTLEKPKAMNFPISKITIGEWTSVMIFPDDLKAKFYFAKKKLMWEVLDSVETETHVAKLKRKIEILWTDVLSFRATFHSHDETGTLEVELGKRPTFFMETNPQAGKHTQWKQMDQDFTQDQSASRCRRHTLHFAPGVLQKNLEKLVSGDSFWSNLAKVTFPTLPQSIYFDIGYGNSNNNNSNSSSPYGHGQTLSFNANNGLLHHHPQGFGHVQLGEVNFDMATQFCANNGRHMNSFVQDNRQNKAMNQLPETQVIQSSSQLISTGRYFGGSQFNNPMIQEERQMRNTGELRGSQAYAQPVPERPTNSMIYPTGPYPEGVLAQAGETTNTGELRGSQAYAQPLPERPINSMIYPTGPYPEGVLAQAGETTNTGELRGSQAYSQPSLETTSNSTIYPLGQYIKDLLADAGETPNMEHTHLDQDGDFQTSNNNDSMPPDF
ncbi:unnamed protein product [Thlaspi arvense]|uniref:TRF2/HOY1 PH-like domain-containing protein n=1 Tax=Thlaspi arvense TaxID=13288 RepID=A0AAU9RYX8_THLAR|nr:unnamed protein product [Thlaspi arvense]